MADCMIPNCKFERERGTSYEIGHNVMMRHLMTHLILELRDLNKTLSARTKSFPETILAPVRSAVAPTITPLPNRGNSTTGAQL